MVFFYLGERMNPNKVACIGTPLRVISENTFIIGKRWGIICAALHRHWMRKGWYSQLSTLTKNSLLKCINSCFPPKADGCVRYYSSKETQSTAKDCSLE